MESVSLLSLFFTAMLAGFIGTWLLVKLAPSLRLIDIPEARSNHSTPTPRGGGLPILLILLLAMGWQEQPWQLMTTVAALGILSLLDDFLSLPAWLRFTAHIVAVSIGYMALPDSLLFRGYLPTWLDHGITLFLWLWFLNLYNFMDGIDGITSAETVHISIGFILIAALTLTPTAWPLWVMISGATLGFSWWNRHPARIFMGDVGSISLGFIIGYWLLTLAKSSQWQAALILPAYYFADGGWTLFKRLLRGEKIWQAHSQHAYQRAARAGLSHPQVVQRVAVLNGLLLILACLSVLYPQTCVWVIITVPLVAWFLYALPRPKKGTSN